MASKYSSSMPHGTTKPLRLAIRPITLLFSAT